MTEKVTSQTLTLTHPFMLNLNVCLGHYPPERSTSPLFCSILMRFSGHLEVKSPKQHGSSTILFVFSHIITNLRLLKRTMAQSQFQCHANVWHLHKCHKVNIIALIGDMDIFGCLPDKQYMTFNYRADVYIYMCVFYLQDVYSLT